MRNAVRDCESCELRGWKAKATKAYVSGFSGDKTHVCDSCFSEAMAVKDALESGPYTNQTETGIGHKGGMSEEMANLLSGSKAADARKALIGILTEPLTAEQASRKAGLDPDYGSPRISELINKGLVVKHDGKGRSDRGNPCGRYIITELAKGIAA